jgi:hypothetical protein
MPDFLRLLWVTLVALLCLGLISAAVALFFVPVIYLLVSPFIK